MIHEYTLKAADTQRQLVDVIGEHQTDSMRHHAERPLDPP